LVFVADEFPIPIRNLMLDEVPSNMISRYQKFHKSFDARILMSHSLKEYYNEYISTRPTFILNTIVDSSRFENMFQEKRENYICYMGNMDLRKDDVQNIIEAFSYIHSDYPNLRLYLYGAPNQIDLNQLQDMVKNLGLETKVLFKGRASHSDVPEILIKSKILVNSQPITKRANGGFPTKLGEYLLSESPSIFTDSGDIVQYVNDGENAFIVPPQQPVLYAEKIRFILNNYDFALVVGRNGSKLIKSNFNTNNQIRSMLSFLEEALKTNK
jgi:glycosyltransferase involved in cell wall biosynthesis